MTDLHRDTLEMVNRLYKDKKYREAIEGLRLLRDADMFEEESANVEFKKRMDGMIALCLNGVKKQRAQKKPPQKKCGHKWECGCDKEVCEWCLENEDDTHDCEDENCKSYYEFRNDNCDCFTRECPYCSSR